MNPELCTECDEPTGRAGQDDDSLYIELGTNQEPVGPLCQSCYDELADPEDDPEDDPDKPAPFECGYCGGSGGGPEHWSCPRCSGTGQNQRAMRQARDEARADRDD